MAPDDLLAHSTILLAATALLQLAATLRYLRAVARGETLPSRTTWLIWTPLAWLTVAGSVEAGAGATLVKLVASALGVTAIAALALFRGTGGRSGLDAACLALTSVGIGLWKLLDDPVLGLAMFMITDFAGAVPTLRDTWHDPRKERPEPWLLGLAASAVSLTLVDPSAWTAGVGGFAIWGFPIHPDRTQHRHPHADRPQEFAGDFSDPCKRRSMPNTVGTGASPTRTAQPVQTSAVVAVTKSP